MNKKLTEGIESVLMSGSYEGDYPMRTSRNINPWNCLIGRENRKENSFLWYEDI